MKRYKKKLKKIGILGGTFDPPHNGHLYISKLAIKKLKLYKLVWAVTKKNPLKKKPLLNLYKRVFYSKKFTEANRKIKVKSFDSIVKSSKTINLIRHIKGNYLNSEIFFLMGSDNLVNFHKWDQWRKISELTKIVVFPRQGYSKKAMTCKAVKSLDKKKFLFIKSKKVNISSSKIRKSYLRYN